MWLPFRRPRSLQIALRMEYSPRPKPLQGKDHKPTSSSEKERVDSKGVVIPQKDKPVPKEDANEDRKSIGIWGSASQFPSLPLVDRDVAASLSSREGLRSTHLHLLRPNFRSLSHCKKAAKSASNVDPFKVPLHAILFIDENTAIFQWVDSLKKISGTAKVSVVIGRNCEG